MDYHATKVWQDAADSSNRPGVELQLWRYRADQDLSSAAPVRDEDGGTYSITIEAGSEEKKVPIAFTNEDGTPVDFPKYDAEGYRYIYVVREYAAERAISGYDQVFGEIDENGNVVEDSDVVLGQREDGTVTDTHPRRGQHLPVQWGYPEQRSQRYGVHLRHQGVGGPSLPGGIRGRVRRSDPAKQAERCGR